VKLKPVIGELNISASVTNYLSSDPENPIGRALDYGIKYGVLNVVEGGFGQTRYITDEGKRKVESVNSLLEYKGPSNTVGKVSVSSEDIKLSIGAGIFVGVGGEAEVSFNVSEAYRRIRKFNIQEKFDSFINSW
jgi:hypothetical protein